MAELYRTPLLSPALERALFLHFNFHKCRFADLRSRLDPHLCRRRDLDQLERHLLLARRVKNRIVTANLRLVVSVARKHLRSELDLMELVSDGNIVLMRAVEGFDVHRGFRFSTYATLALMKGFARSVPELQRGGGSRLAAREIGCRDEELARVNERDQIHVMLGRLDESERRVVAAHYGVGEDSSESAEAATLEALSQVLGMTKHRVRQIEQAALSKLRRMAAETP
jgi:RNA polymerase sigma factor (sigma-70 family)